MPRIAESAKVVADGTLDLLRAIRDSSDAFPPLKSGLSAGLLIIDLSKRFRSNKKYWRDFGDRVRDDLEVVASWANKNVDTTTLFEADLRKLQRTLEGIASAIKDIRSQPTWQRALQISKDVEIIQDFRSQLDRALSDFQVQSHMEERQILAQSQLESIKSNLHPVDAAFDSSKSCLPGTRVKVLADMTSWALSSARTDYNSDRIFWLSGAAGTGKSTIAHSLAKHLRDETTGNVVCFFFKRTEEACSNPNRLFATLAFGLAQLSNILAEAIIAAIKKQPDMQADIQRQFQYVIAQPLSILEKSLQSQTDSGQPIKPIICILDAFDECGDPHSRKVVLGCLQSGLQTMPSWVKWIIMSRPEIEIQQRMENSNAQILEMGNLEDTEADIETYISTLLKDIALEKGLSDWPSQEQINQLKIRSGGLFISAYTTYLVLSNKLNPVAALNYMLANIHRDVTPQDNLDQIYAQTLSQSITLDHDNLQDFQDVMCVLVAIRTPLSIGGLTQLMDNPAFSFVIPKLGHILRTHNKHSNVSFIHPSFVDFITSSSRSSNWMVDVTHGHEACIRACLKLINKKLCRNICDLPNNLADHNEILDLHERIEAHISTTVQYACQYWTAHLKLSKDYSIGLLQLVLQFVKDHVLHWLEILSLKAQTHTVLDMLMDIKQWHQDMRQQKASKEDNYMQTLGSELTEFINDIERFIQRFFPWIDKCSQQIYWKALSSSPKKSLIYQKFISACPDIPMVISDSVHWGTNVATLSGHTHEILSVAISNDNNRIVSGSWDGNIIIWNAYTGSMIGTPLHGHKGGVMAVAISQHVTTRIFSASHDKTVRIWDITDTVSSTVLEGHNDTVRTIAFSDAKNKIVSGSYDSTLIIWDAESGAAIGSPLIGHESGVISVAVSFNGNRIVSGSWDKTIRIWDLDTGNCISGAITGHQDAVMSIAISFDGKKIFSGSADKTIHIWDTDTGISIDEPLRGHREAVCAVASSSDGQMIVSGSLDHTITLWDLRTGKSASVAQLQHAGRAVIFSNDQTKLISGSSDSYLRIWDITNIDALKDTLAEKPEDNPMTVTISRDGIMIVCGFSNGIIKCWNTYTGVLMGVPLKANTTSVLSVAISPDGQKIASGSRDCTVRIWDTKTWTQIGKPWVHDMYVTAVVFAPDGQRLYSASFDKTIRVWNLDTGDIIYQLIGHTDIVSSLAISPDGKTIASGSRDRTIRIWDTETGIPIGEPLEGHTSNIPALAFLPDNNRVFSGSWDKSLRIWDIKSGTCIFGSWVNRSFIRSVAVSPDGTRLISASDDATVRIWDVNSGECIGRPLEGHDRQVWSIAISRDGTKIISASWDKTVRVWKV